MSVTASLLLGLVLSSQPVTEEPAKYSIDVSKTTSEVKPGGDGTFWMHIQVAPGFKVSTEAPLKVALTADKLKLQKAKLAAADAKDKKDPSPLFSVKFQADEQCQTAIDVDASFFVCDDKICERKTAKLSVPVSVRP